MKLSGFYTAIITPFIQNGDIDYDAMKKLLERQVNAGISGIVLCGTTGENPTLSDHEQAELVAFARKHIPSSCRLIVGTGSNSTQKSIELSQKAASLGADMVMLVTPYYNKPTISGLLAHFTSVHDAVDIPIMLYNVPSRTGTSLSIDMVQTLSKLPRIMAIKDATDDIMRPMKLRQACGDDFSILSGEDASIMAFLAHGGDGAVSVTSNIVPDSCMAFYHAMKTNNLEKAYQIQSSLTDLHDAMFVESNPVPVKYALSKLGLIDNQLRLPLVPATEHAMSVVDFTLDKFFAIPDNNKRYG